MRPPRRQDRRAPAKARAGGGDCPRRHARSRHGRCPHPRRADGPNPADVHRGDEQGVVPGDRLLRRPDGVPRRAHAPDLGEAPAHGERRRGPRLPERAGAGVEARRPHHPHRHHPPPGLRRHLHRQREGQPVDRGADAHEGRELAIQRDPDDPPRRPAEIRPSRDRGLPGRGRQPEPQRGDRIGRPEGGARARHVPQAVDRVDLLCRVPPSRQGRGARPLQPPLPPGRQLDAGVVGRRRVDLGQRQSLDHDPRHQLPGRARLRRLPERRPRLLPGRRHRDLQRPRPEPGRPGVPGPAAPQSGLAVRSQRRLGLLVGQQPEHVHPQRRRRVRPVRLSLRGAQDGRLRPRAPHPAARRLGQARRHPHLAVRPIRGERGPLPPAVRHQPRRLQGDRPRRRQV